MLPVEDPALLASIATTPPLPLPLTPAEPAATVHLLAVALPQLSATTAVALPKETASTTPLVELAFTEEALLRLFQLAASGELQSQEHHEPIDGNEFLLFEDNDEHASAIVEECDGAVAHPSQHPVLLPSSLAAAAAALAEPWAASDGVLCDACWNTADQTGPDGHICRRIHSGGLHSCLQIVHLGMERHRARRSASPVPVRPSAEIVVKAGGSAHWKRRHGVDDSPLASDQEHTAEADLEVWWLSGPPSALRQLDSQADQKSLVRTTTTPSTAKKHNVSATRARRDSQKLAAFGSAKIDRVQASDFFDESSLPDCDHHDSASPLYCGGDDDKLAIESHSNRRTRWGPAWILQAAHPVFPMFWPTWSASAAGHSVRPRDDITTSIEASLTAEPLTKKRSRVSCGVVDSADLAQMRDGGGVATSGKTEDGAV